MYLQWSLQKSDQQIRQMTGAFWNSVRYMRLHALLRKADAANACQISAFITVVFPEEAYSVIWGC